LRLPAFHRFRWQATHTKRLRPATPPGKTIAQSGDGEIEGRAMRPGQ
jgi:hypothetical protein